MMQKIFTTFIFTIVLFMAIGIFDGNAQVANDAGITSINTPACTPSLSVQLANTGTNNINPVKIGWSVNGAYQTVNNYNQLLKSGDSINFTLSPNYNFVNGTTYAIKVFTYAPNNVTDGDKKNDTSKLTFKFYATAQNPSVTHFVQCGPGKASLTAIPGNADDSILWYNAAIGGSVIAKGKNALSPSLSFGVDTFFAQAFKMGSICPSGRVALKITVNPSPNGAAFIKGTPFESPNLNTTGTNIDPDIVTYNNKLTYELTPPTGYSNAGYGSTWMSMTPVLKSLKGMPINPRYWTYTAPSGSTPGKFTFKPDKDIVDSFYTVSLQIRDLGPHYCDSTINRHIFVAPRPEPNFKFNSPICEGDTVVFTNTSSISSGTLSHKWNFGTGNPADIANTKDAKFKFTKNGTYYVKLVTTSNTNIKDSIVKTITLTESPNADFTWGAACNLTKTDFKFTGTKPAGALTVFLWDMNGEGTSTLENPSNLFSTTGDKKISLTLTSNNGCWDSITKTINVRPQAKANFVVSDVCQDDSAIFINKSIGAETYRWKFGDGLDAYIHSPKHKYLNNGVTLTFNVTLIAKISNGCSDSIAKPITINANPKSDFTYTMSGYSVYFKPSQAGNVIYKWTFGDGDSSSTIQIAHKYPKPGQYDVCLYVISAAGCFSKGCHSISIKPCKAEFTKSIDTSQKFKIYLINNSTNTSTTTYLWDFGDGDSSTSRNPAHKYSTFGKFNVCLTVQDSSCSSTFCDTIGLDSTGKLLKAGTFEVVVIEGVGSISNKKPKDDFTIYPNPVNSKVTVDLSNSLVHYDKLEVVDAIGQLCLNHSIEKGNKVLELDLGIIKPGLYFIKLSNNQGYSYMKMIKN